MRTLFLPIAFLLLCSVQAQNHVKITDAKALDSAPDVQKAKAVQAGLAASGLPEDQSALVLKFGDHSYWPEGIREEKQRHENAPYIQNYSCFRICTFPQDSVAMAVLMVPAKENIHMPEIMRPLADFYLVLPERALTPVGTEKPRPEISRGPKWTNLPEAKIIKPDELYATYDLSQDSTGLVALAAKGMSPAEIDAVVFRSQERNWPDGIDSYDERSAKLDKFKKYKAYLGAKWDDKVLLIIPVEKNKKQPTLLRPFVDLYFVYNTSGVEVTKKK